MALEEPELHLPPATQQQLVLRVQALSSQTFITTHSPTIAAMADPTSVLMLRNVEGQLAAEPFLSQKLGPDAANWQRKFYQHNRTEVIDALMHATVLVPEGRSDHMLLKTVLKPLMLRQGWGGEHAHSFGLKVGVIPTEDAKVVETARDLLRIHPRVCCLVDGDDDGQRYVRNLAGLAQPPSAVIRWPDGQMIEDAIGWILEVDAASVVNLANDVPALVGANIAGVVAHMKTKKCDLVLYEAVAEAICGSDACRVRASEFFQAIASACTGIATPRFIQRDQALVFQP